MIVEVPIDKSSEEYADANQQEKIMSSKEKFDVFISCKSEDYPQAENLSAFLRSNGLNPFLASESLLQ